MCDDIDCDGDCCTTNECCDCCCCCLNDTIPQPADAGTGGGGDGDNDCLFYLCCAGCFLCPLFYVGTIKQQQEEAPIATGAVKVTPVHDKDDGTGTVTAATVVTSESTAIPTTTAAATTTLTTVSHDGGVPSTVIMDNEQLKMIEQQMDDPIESTRPMDRGTIVNL